MYPRTDLLLTILCLIASFKLAFVNADDGPDYDPSAVPGIFTSLQTSGRSPEWNGWSGWTTSTQTETSSLPSTSGSTTTSLIRTSETSTYSTTTTTTVTSPPNTSTITTTVTSFPSTSMPRTSSSTSSRFSTTASISSLPCSFSSSTSISSTSIPTPSTTTIVSCSSRGLTSHSISTHYSSYWVTQTFFVTSPVTSTWIACSASTATNSQQSPTETTMVAGTIPGRLSIVSASNSSITETVKVTSSAGSPIATSGSIHLLAIMNSLFMASSVVASCLLLMT